MGHEELVKSLRREADEQVRSIWVEAENEAARLREEAQAESGRIREEFEKKLAKAVEDQDQVILKEARNKARTIKLSAEKALSGRLFSLALSCLKELRDKDRREVFISLCRELPDAVWDRVRVFPEDLKYASELFPDSTVEPDDNMTGGVHVTGRNGKICITNTFEKRLERAWEDMLPLLTGDVYKEISEHETSSEN
jgi:vacuolar-type H+-ATPase subunit E/Vma4